MKEVYYTDQDNMMLAVHEEVQTGFENILREKINPPVQYQPYYRRWLRYYWDFCHKYGYPLSEQKSLPFYVRKLQEKSLKDFFATHLLQVNYDIRTIQELLGHSDVIPIRY